MNQNLRNIVNERNRITPINIIPDKEFLKTVYGDGDIQMDWYELGYQMSAGIIGTGWMMADINDYEDMSSEAIWEDVFGWTQTLQWEYEVGKKMLKEITELDDDIRIERYQSKIQEWVDGYVSWITEHNTEE